MQHFYPEAFRKERKKERKERKERKEKKDREKERTQALICKSCFIDAAVAQYKSACSRKTKILTNFCVQKVFFLCPERKVSMNCCTELVIGRTSFFQVGWNPIIS